MSGDRGRQSNEKYPGWDVTPDELEFLKAMERYQRRMRRRYPTWREALAVLKSLGYRKVEATPPPEGEGRKTEEALFLRLPSEGRGPGG